MAKTHETRLVVAADPELVLQILTSESYNIEQESSQGAIDVRYALLRKEETLLIYEVHATRYARGMTGVNRNKTETQVTTSRWRLDDFAAEWKYAGPHGDRVKVHGETRLRKVDAGTEIHDILHIDVSVPLIGGKIEGMVVNEMQKGFDTYKFVVEKHIALASG